MHEGTTCEGTMRESTMHVSNSVAIIKLNSMF